MKISTLQKLCRELGTKEGKYCFLEISVKAYSTGTDKVEICLSREDRDNLRFESIAGAVKHLEAMLEGQKDEEIEEDTTKGE